MFYIVGIASILWYIIDDCATKGIFDLNFIITKNFQLKLLM